MLHVVGEVCCGCWTSMLHASIRSFKLGVLLGARKIRLVWPGTSPPARRLQKGNQVPLQN